MKPAIRPGDIMLQINQKNIANLEDYKAGGLPDKSKGPGAVAHPQEERRPVRDGQAGVDQGC